MMIVEQNFFSFSSTLRNDNKTENDDPRVTQLLNKFLLENTDFFFIIKGDNITPINILKHMITPYADTTPIYYRPKRVKMGKKFFLQV